MSFLNQTQRFQLGTLLKGAARVHGFEDIPEWWGHTSLPNATALQQFDSGYGEFNLNTLFKMGLDIEIEKSEQQDCLFRSLWLQKAAGEIQAHFTTNNVRFTFVKGIAQDAKYWHQNPARIFADIDLWVHPDDIGLCNSIINSLCYEPVGPYHNESFASRNLPNTYQRNDRGNITSLDVHPLPFDGFRKTHTWDDVWPRVYTCNTAVGPRNLLPPEDEIIFWAGNQLKSLFGAWPKACLDIYVLIHKEDINWSNLVEKARAAQLVWPTWALLSALNAADIKIPQHHLNRLSPPEFITKRLVQAFRNPIKLKTDFPNSLSRLFWVLILSGDYQTGLRLGMQWIPHRMGDKIRTKAAKLFAKKYAL